MRALTILLADDHPLMRQGIRSVLESQPGWTVRGDADNGREAVAMAKRLSPDVAVIDITMPELNGIEAARQIRREMPSVEILILTMHHSDALIAGALEAGDQRIRMVHSENQNFHRGHFTTNLAGSFYPIQLRHSDVDHGYVRRKPLRHRNGLTAIVSVAANRPARLAFQH